MQHFDLNIIQVYISSMSKVYERQVSDFFERGKMSLGLGLAASASGTTSNRLAPGTLSRFAFSCHVWFVIFNGPVPTKFIFIWHFVRLELALTKENFFQQSEVWRVRRAVWTKCLLFPLLPPRTPEAGLLGTPLEGAPSTEFSRKFSVNWNLSASKSRTFAPNSFTSSISVTLLL